MSSSMKLKNTFGYDPDEGNHHFLVIIPSKVDSEAGVSVYECLRFSENQNDDLLNSASEKVVFSSQNWKAVSENVRSTFNLRLKDSKLKTGSWQIGQNYLSPHFGKELTLLGWALEDLDSSFVNTVFKNWKGLAPEERWWLYGTANAPFSQNPKKGRGLGWRKDLSIALSENPLIETINKDLESINELDSTKSQSKLKKVSSTSALLNKKKLSTLNEEVLVTGSIDQSLPIQQKLFDL